MMYPLYYDSPEADACINWIIATQESDFEKRPSKDHIYYIAFRRKHSIEYADNQLENAMKLSQGAV